MILHPRMHERFSLCMPNASTIHYVGNNLHFCDFYTVAEKWRVENLKTISMPALQMSGLIIEFETYG